MAGTDTYAAIKYGPQIINAVNKWGPAVKHCVGGLGMDTMEDEDENPIISSKWLEQHNK